MIARGDERCFCDAAMARRCRCCRRPRCDEHLARGLCDRCGQAVDRRRPGLSAWAWTIGGGAGAALTLGLTLVGVTSAIVLGFAVAVVAGGAGYQALVARAINQLRPELATTVGELPLPPRDEPNFPRPGGGGTSGGGARHA